MTTTEEHKMFETVAVIIGQQGEEITCTGFTTRGAATQFAKDQNAAVGATGLDGEVFQYARPSK